MGQVEDSRNARRNKHVNWEERIQIETLHREGFRPASSGAPGPSCQNDQTGN